MKKLLALALTLVMTWGWLAPSWPQRRRMRSS